MAVGATRQAFGTRAQRIALPRGTYTHAMSGARTSLLTAVALIAAIATTASAQQARLVKDIDPRVFSKGSNPMGIATIGNTTLFWGTTEETGTEVWKTDGTERGTEVVRDIWPGPSSSLESNDWRTPAIVLGSRVIFPASDGEHGT